LELARVSTGRLKAVKAAANIDELGPLFEQRFRSIAESYYTQWAGLRCSMRTGAVDCVADVTMLSLP
jgi:hypothetical protein